MKKLILVIAFSILAMACDPMSIVPGAKGKFEDQGFKTAVAMIELHKIRNGKYPEKLKDIKFEGAWDPIYKQFVIYELKSSGYKLGVRSDAADDLEYPPEFWSGFGIVETNVQGFTSNKSINYAPSAPNALKRASY